MVTLSAITTFLPRFLIPIQSLVSELKAVADGDVQFNSCRAMSRLPP